MKGSAAHGGIQKSASVEEPYMGDSSRPTFLASPRMNAVTPVERAVKCGLSRDEAERFERLVKTIDMGQDDIVVFLIRCVQKLVEKHRPKYTYEDIVEMHKHL